MTPQNDDIFDFQLMRHPLTELFHLSTLLQMLNRRMVGTASFGRFSCSYDRMSLDGPSFPQGNMLHKQDMGIGRINTQNFLSPQRCLVCC